MKIVVVGATGNVGARIVDAALAAGHQVVAYVRRPEAMVPRKGLTVAQGDAVDVGALAAAAAGADAVIVSITGSTKDATFMQRTLPQVIEAVKLAKAGRLVLVSAFGAGDTAELASGFARLIYRTVLGTFFGDKAASDSLLMRSGVDYTIVYPVNLKAAPALPAASVKRLEHVGKVPGLPTLPFENVATALVEIAGDKSLSGARVLVTTPKGWKPA
ncbi:putative NAD(P)-binding protein [Microterricola gilva]|uniref:Putative NAD(P)-binding protein n=2 Tax=Microterricola gilva TaxID=393267 RepID=A0A4Q8ASD6_9MICO|nr:putative NAD(P)-binding protein [Microterricola gilva]